MRFVITQDPIDAEAVRRAVLGDDPRANPSGAIVVFHGTVRNKTLDRRVTHLEYEGFEPMALKQMEAIADEVIARHALTALACAHRIGRLAIGEDAMVVAVAAPHRKAALDATEDFISRLKQDVPIWKKEHFEGGAVWVGSPDDPQGAGTPPADAGPATPEGGRP